MQYLTRALTVLLAAALHHASPAAAQDKVERGAYLFRAAGCAGCHTDRKGGGEPLAGGRALETPFGIFYGPNITPDPDYGIGKWSQEDFRNALRHGVAPNGAPYYPSFPYTSFTALGDGDIDDMWSYLRSVPAVASPNRAHELKFPFSLRGLLLPWQWLFFEPGPFEPAETLDADSKRGAYLVQAVGHCGECHSPRGPLGDVDESLALAGNPLGPEGEPVPNITSDEKHGIGSWTVADITTYLSFGMTPKGDFAGGAMAEVIRQSTNFLSEADRTAVALYLKNTTPKPSPGKLERPEGAVKIASGADSYATSD